MFYCSVYGLLYLFKIWNNFGKFWLVKLLFDFNFKLLLFFIFVFVLLLIECLEFFLFVKLWLDFIFLFWFFEWVCFVEDFGLFVNFGICLLYSSFFGIVGIVFFNSLSLLLKLLFVFIFFIEVFFFLCIVLVCLFFK